MAYYSHTVWWNNSQKSDLYFYLKTEQWKLTGDIVIIICHCHHILQLWRKHIHFISLHNLHGLLWISWNQIKTLLQIQKIIEDFKEMMASQMLLRFELWSLHTAYPLLIGSLLDPCFNSITNSKKRTPRHWKIIGCSSWHWSKLSKQQRMIPLHFVNSLALATELLLLLNNRNWLF